MDHVKIQKIVEDIEFFVDTMKSKHGLTMGVTVLQNNRMYDVSKYVDVLGYLKKNKRTVTKRITLYDIEYACITSLNVSGISKMKDINTRHRPLIYYRHVFCYLARQFKFSFKTIGNFIGKDHATVIHSSRLISDLLSIQDAEIVRIYNSCYTNLELLLNPYINEVKEDEQVVPVTDDQQDIGG